MSHRTTHRRTGHALHDSHHAFGHNTSTSCSLFCSTRMPCSSALDSSHAVKRSNSHSWGLLFPRIPHESSRISLTRCDRPRGQYTAGFLHGHVWSRLVLCEDELRAVGLQIEPFAQTEFVVLGVLMPFCFLVTVEREWLSPRSRSGRIRICVTFVGLFEPTVERSEFFENALCPLSEAHWHHETAEPSRTNLTENGGLCTVSFVVFSFALKVGDRILPVPILVGSGSGRRSTVSRLSARSHRGRHSLANG